MPLPCRVPDDGSTFSKMMRLRGLLIFVVFVTSVFLPGAARAHGVVGRRYIPSTMALDDPFPSDTMKLFTFERESQNKGETETSVGFEFSKRLSLNFALGIEWEYLFIEHGAGPTTSGFGNPEFFLKYALFRSAEHESIVSVGFDVKPGGVGSKRVAEKVTTLTPALFFAKGFGDLSESFNYLKPIAVTGIFEVDNPANRRTGAGAAREHHPTTLGYGVAVMYSIPYLQTFVRDVGLKPPFDRFFPIVEFNFETSASQHDKGRTTAFASPGVLWAGKYFQLGLQAQIPMNEASGKNAGVRGMMHWFIDNIAPDIFTWTPWGVIGPTQK